MDQFKVGLSGDFIGPDGGFAFPSVDLTPLDDDPRIDWSFIPVADGKVEADSVKGLDALILLGAEFGPDSFPGDGRLAMIARFGVGYDNVDVPGCDANNVALVITPSGVRRPVAVSILTFIFALSGNLLVKDRLTRSGPEGWAQRASHMGVGLIGRTLGSIGVGNIGAELFRLAQPFGMEFIACDPYADAQAAEELGVRMVELEEVFRLSDFLCVNCPLTDETKGLVNAQTLSLMKPGAYLINTARGPIVDQAALVDALRSGRISGAGLDVFEEEPSSPSDRLFELENVIVTPHSLCWTDQCFAGIGAADINAVLDLVDGNEPEGIVNRSILRSEDWRAKLRSYGSRFGPQNR